MRGSEVERVERLRGSEVERVVPTLLTFTLPFVGTFGDFPTTSFNNCKSVGIQILCFLHFYCLLKSLVGTFSYFPTIFYKEIIK